MVYMGLWWWELGIYYLWKLGEKQLILCGAVVLVGAALGVLTKWV